MKSILFHIGYHKTASSWLQDQLFVKGNEVFHPLSESDRGHSSFAKNFVMDKDAFSLNSFEMNTPFLLSEYKRLTDQDDIDEKILVVSQERLSGNPHSGGFDSSLIAKRIAAFNPNAKVLFLIREQSSWLVSNYFQYLRVGGTISLPKYLNQQYGRRPYFSYKHIMYHHLIDGYQNLLGKEQVCVIPYELLKTDPKAFTEKLSAFIGKEIVITDEQLKTKVHASNDYYANSFFRRLNWMKDKNSINNYSILSNRVTRAIMVRVRKYSSFFISKKMNQKTFTRSKQIVEEWCGDRYALSNQKTQELTGLQLKQYGYRV